MMQSSNFQENHHTQPAEHFWDRISFRYLAIIIACLVVVQAGFGAYQIYTDFQQQTNDLENRATRQTAFLSQITSESVWVNDFLSMEIMAETSSDDPDIVYTVVISAEGQPLTRYLNRDDPVVAAAIDATEEKAILNVLSTLRTQSTINEVRRPIISDEKLLGEVWVGYSSARAQQSLVNSVIRTALATILISVLLGVLSIVVFNVQVSKPLEDVGRLAQALASGQLSERAAVKRIDEIGQLQLAFNQMASQLQDTLDGLKNANEATLAANQELERSNDELKEFAYVVSHDLKTPLRGIGSLASWLRSDYTDHLDDDGKEMLELLSSRVNIMESLIEGILLYSRVGRITEQHRPVDLNQIVTDVLELIAPPAHIDIVLENALPVVLAEETRMMQLYQNLLSNAVKYMDKPNGLIHIGSKEHNADEWLLWVKDNGSGIDPKYHEKIFVIFQTLEQSDGYESSGIGLTIVKKILEVHGGHIWIESAVDQGATFFFTLPKMGPLL
ncbi:MAG: ATP-binding protein [Chloroflexota bacterium]